MTLEEHAAAIQAAIQAAADEGYELDNGWGASIDGMELARIVDRVLRVVPEPVRIHVPRTFG